MVVLMAFRFLRHDWPDSDRRRSTPAERLAWEERRRTDEIKEREEIERRLSYLEYQMGVLTGKDSRP